MESNKLNYGQVSNVRFKKIIKMFEDGNVAVCGLRGRGKDMLTANVVVRRGKPYVSNINYGGVFNPLDLDKLDVGGNTYKDFISGNVKPYIYPYEDGTDVYISDVGVYFPAQYCNELNRDYKSLPVFMALSRHVGACNLHFNVQSLNRAYDKLREQCDCYVHCNKCYVIKFLGIVLQQVTIYDNYQSAVERRDPLVLPKIPLFALNRRQLQMQREIAVQQFKASHGNIKRGWLIYRNKSEYDTRFFKRMLGGEKDEEDNTSVDDGVVIEFRDDISCSSVKQ